MDGFELCKEIRKVDDRVPILMLTALGAADDKLEGFDVGADDYMVKSFDFRELTARVRVLLKRQAVSAEVLVKQIAYAEQRSYPAFPKGIQPARVYGRERGKGNQPRGDSGESVEYPF